MAYGIIRVQNLKMHQVGGVQKHNFREFSPGETPGHIGEENVEKWGRNKYYFYQEGYGSIQDAIQGHLTETNTKGVRKNSVVALEFVVAINDQNVWNHYHPDGFFGKTAQWLEQQYGGKVVASAIHTDESNPHAHIVLVPTKEKEVKWKNKNGSGVRIETRLSARDITGGPEKLREMQDDFHKYIKTYEKKMETKFYRGTSAKHNKRFYQKETNRVMGEIRKNINSMTPEEKAIAFEKLYKLQDSLEKAELGVKRAEKKNSGNRWKKGVEYTTNLGANKPLKESSKNLLGNVAKTLGNASKGSNRDYDDENEKRKRGRGM